MPDTYTILPEAGALTPPELSVVVVSESGEGSPVVLLALAEAASPEGSITRVSLSYRPALPAPKIVEVKFSGTPSPGDVFRVYLSPQVSGTRFIATKSPSDRAGWVITPTPDVPANYSLYAYAAVSGDTAASVVASLAALISGDVTAEADGLVLRLTGAAGDDFSHAAKYTPATASPNTYSAGPAQALATVVTQGVLPPSVGVVVDTQSYVYEGQDSDSSADDFLSGLQATLAGALPSGFSSVLSGSHLRISGPVDQAFLVVKLSDRVPVYVGSLQQATPSQPQISTVSIGEGIPASAFFQGSVGVSSLDRNDQIRVRLSNGSDTVEHTVEASGALLGADSKATSILVAQEIAALFLANELGVTPQYVGEYLGSVFVSFFADADSDGRVFSLEAVVQQDARALPVKVSSTVREGVYAWEQVFCDLLQPTERGGLYRGTLPAQSAVEGEDLVYRFRAFDNSSPHRLFTDSDEYPLSFLPDNDPPVLVSSSPALNRRKVLVQTGETAFSLADTGDSIAQLPWGDVDIELVLEDLSALDATLFWRLAGQEDFQAAELGLGAEATYRTQIRASDLVATFSREGAPPELLTLEVYLVLSDLSPSRNTVQAPLESRGFHPVSPAAALILLGAPLTVEKVLSTAVRSDLLRQGVDLEEVFYELEILADTAPPDVSHTEPQESPIAGSSIPLSARVTDPAGIRRVSLFFRPIGASPVPSSPLEVGEGWYSVPMLPPMGSDLDELYTSQEYEAYIPAEFVTLSGLEYYIEAEDYFGNLSTVPTLKGATLPQPSFDGKWKPFNLASLFPDYVAQAFEGLDATVEVVKTILQVLEAIIQTASFFLVSFPDPLTLAVQALIVTLTALKNALQDLLATGLYWFIYLDPAFRGEWLTASEDVQAAASSVLRRAASRAAETTAFGSTRKVLAEWTEDLLDQTMPKVAETLPYSEGWKVNIDTAPQPLPKGAGLDGFFTAIEQTLGIQLPMYLSQLLQLAKAQSRDPSLSLGQLIYDTRTMSIKAPDFSPDADVLTFFLVGGVDSFPDVQPFLESLATLLDFTEFQDLLANFPDIKFPSDPRATIKTNLYDPDWDSVTLGSFVPFLGKVIDAADEVIRYLKPSTDIFTLVEELLAVLDAKVAALEAFAERLDELIAAIEALIAFSGFFGLFVNSSMSPDFVEFAGLSSSAPGSLRAMDKIMVAARQAPGFPLGPSAFVTGVAITAGTADFKKFYKLLGGDDNIFEGTADQIAAAWAEDGPLAEGWAASKQSFTDALSASEAQDAAAQPLDSRDILDDPALLDDFYEGNAYWSPAAVPSELPPQDPGIIPALVPEISALLEVPDPETLQPVEIRLVSAVVGESDKFTFTSTTAYPEVRVLLLDPLGTIVTSTLFSAVGNSLKSTLVNGQEAEYTLWTWVFYLSSLVPTLPPGDLSTYFSVHVYVYSVDGTGAIDPLSALEITVDPPIYVEVSLPLVLP